nr:hypothetical protein [Pyrinomonadaceae bacterium]
GFTEKIGLVIYDTKSETLWSNLIKEVFSRIISKNKIEHKDKIWFKDRINEIIKKIQKGEIDTGEFNEMNIFYLDRLNDSVEIYCN